MRLRERISIAGKALVGLISDNAATQAFGLLGNVYPATGPQADRGTLRTLESYSELPWLRAISQKIAQSVASVEWQLFVPEKGSDRDRASNLGARLKKSSGDARQKAVRKHLQTGDLRRIDSHIFLDALSNANEYLVGPALMRTTQVHIDLVGEAFWIKERNGLGAPVGFWPLPPNWVEETPIPTRRTYKVNFSAWHGDIPDTEIVWIADPDPANPYGRGTGIAKTLADELETDEYAARHTRMTFLNRARPDLIIWPEEGKDGGGTMTRPQADRLAERWRSDHQGFWRASKPYFATRKIGIKEVNQSFKDLELTSLRKQERDIIIQTFGIPPEMLGIIENSNRSTIDAADFLFKRNVVVPRLEFLRATLQERLVPEYDERLILDYESPVDADKEHNLKVAQASPWSMSVDEWRDAQGLDPLDDDKGQVHFIPNNLVAVTDITVPPVTAPPPTPIAGTPPAQRAVPSWAHEALDAEEWPRVVAALRDAGDDLSADLIRKEIEPLASEDTLPDVPRAVSRQERALRLWLFGKLLELRDDADLDEIVAATEAQNVERIIQEASVGEWALSIEDEIATRLQEAFLAGATVGARAAGGTVERQDGEPFTVDFNLVEPRAVEWARAHTADLVVGVSSATTEGIRTAVVQSLEAGLDVRRTAEMIRQSIGLTPRQAASVAKLSQRLAAEDVAAEVIATRTARLAEAHRRVRALVIARTELVMAGNAGQQAVWNMAVEAGHLNRNRLKKIWIAVFDAEAICQSLALEDPVGINESFSNGLQQPPAHPNCRCSTGLMAVAEARSVTPELPAAKPELPSAAQSIVRATASRLMARECAVVRGTMKMDAEERAAALTTFYLNFADELVTDLALSRVTASSYCADHAECLRGMTVDSTIAWDEDDHIDFVTSLALSVDPLAQMQRDLAELKAKASAPEAPQPPPQVYVTMPEITMPEIKIPAPPPPKLKKTVRNVVRNEDQLVTQIVDEEQLDDAPEDEA